MPNTKHELALFSAIKSGNSLRVSRLLDKQVNIHARNTAGESVMHLAALRGSVRIIDLLVEHGAAIEINDHRRNKPLHMAALKGHTAALKRLLEQGAQTDHKNNMGNTAIHFAADGGKKDCLDTLIQAKANLNLRNTYEDLALHRAIRSGQLEIIELLLKHGSLLEHANHQNDTPLSLAVRKSKKPLIQLLVNAGASLTTVDRNGDSILHIAITTGRVHIVEMLIEAQVNIHTANLSGLTPIMLAHIRNKPSLVRLLRNHGATLPDNFAQITAQQTQMDSLAAIANDPENAIRPPTADQLELIAQLHQQYAKKVTDPQTIFNEIARYLSKQYLLHPATSANNAVLPLRFNASLPDQKPYYQHVVHTAWRYLLQPNPWILPTAKYANKRNRTAFAAEISNEDKVTLACLWLAAKNEGRVDVLINEIAHMARAHNWDKFRIDPTTERKIYFDDMQPDNPSCSSGLKKHFCEFLPLLPSLAHIRPLNTEAFKQRFESQLLSENPEIPHNLYGKLNGLSIEELNALKTGIESSFIMLEPLDEAQRTVLAINPNVITEFIEGCSDFYGKEKWDKRKDEAITPNIFKQYPGYHAYALALAENPAEHCYERLAEIIDNLILKKKRELPSKPALVFSSLKPTPGPKPVPPSGPITRSASLYGKKPY